MRLLARHPILAVTLMAVALACGGESNLGPPTPTFVRFVADTVVMDSGTGFTVDARLLDQYGGEIGQTLVFYPLQPLVVQVSLDGFAYALQPGIGRVVAAYGPLTDTLVVQVTSPNLFPGRPFGVAVSLFGDIYLSQLDLSRVSHVSLANPDPHVAIPIAVGASPSVIALDPTGATLYVANQSSGTISVVSTATNAEVAAIPVTAAPLAVAVSPDGSRLYATNTDRTLFIIDPQTRTILDTLALGDGPYGMAFNPAADVMYVGSRNSGEVAEIDTQKDSVLRVFTVGGRPHDIAISNDRLELYVANLELQALQIVNIASGTVVASLPLGSAFGLGLSSNGRRLYVGLTAGGKVMIVDPVSRSVLDSVVTGGSPKRIAIAPDGVTAVVANESGLLHILP